jgi:hypothetical protein
MQGTWNRIGQLTLVLLTTAALGTADTGNMPPPGTLNYVEGQVSVQGQRQTPDSVGSTCLQSNQELRTRDGNAEMLLTPGVYLRVGHRSTVKMLSPGLANTQVQLTRGSAILEVDELFQENNLSVVMDGATTRIEKKGLYEFHANPPAAVKVLDGKAATFEGSQRVGLKKGREVLLAEGQSLVRRKFNKDAAEEDPLFRWSKLRSDYATESNVQTANALLAEGGWWGPGWYWDPFWYDFAFLPGGGPLWGPFGFPFFSPWCVGWAPYYGFGGYHPYPHPLAHTFRGLPPLAHHLSAGSPGFRAFPHGLASGQMGLRMGGFPHARFGMGFRRGAFGSAFHGGFHGGGIHAGFGGRR